MSINYNKIKERVSLLYNYVYGNNSSIHSNYGYVKFDIANIKITDLVATNKLDYQLILNSNYDTKENFKIKNIIGDELYKKIILKKYFKDYPLTIIIQKYTHNDNMINITDISYELFINQIVSEFAIVEKVPFFLLNISNFNIGLQQLANYKDFYDLVTKEYALYEPSDIDANFCISVYEHYHSYITFDELLKEKLEHIDLKNILFQLFFTYAYIQTKLDNFSHGDYTVNSFLIMKNDGKSNIKLYLGDNLYQLKDSKYICKLFNYRKSQIKGFKNTSNIIVNEDNPTYSIYTILKSLYDKTKELNNENHENIKLIINNFTPVSLFDKKYLGENEFYSIFMESLIPSQILSKNNFFSNFINMNFKHNTSEPNQDLKGGNINKKNIDIFKNIIIDSDASKPNESEVVGYRALTGGAKSKSKTKVKKNSKKNSKNKKYSKQSREKLNGHQDLSETALEEESENIDSYGEEDEEDEMVELSGIDETDDENKKQKNKMNKEDDIEDNEISSNISPDTENQNESLVSEGDDDNETVPIDSEEMGMNYKEIIKKLMKENKNLKRSTMKKSSKTKKSSKSSKSKKSKKSNTDNSSSLNLDDIEEEFGNKNIQNKESGLFNQIFQNPSQSQPQNQFNSNPIAQQFQSMQPMQSMQSLQSMQPMQSMQSFQSMQPTNEYALNSNQQFNQGFSSNGIYKMKQGSNNNFNEILGGLNQEGLIPVLPEMQQYFNMDQISQMPQSGPQADYQFGMSSQPQIMDPGLLGNSMKRPLPLVSDPSLANMGGLGSANSMGPIGNALGEFGKENKNMESNSMSKTINDPTPMPTPIPFANANTNANANANTNANTEPSNQNAIQIDGAENFEADNGVLNGGSLKKKKNFFLTKKQ